MKTFDELVHFEESETVRDLAIAMHSNPNFGPLVTDFLKGIMPDLGESPEAIRGALCLMRHMAIVDHHMEFIRDYCDHDRFMVWDSLISGMPAFFAAMPEVKAARDLQNRQREEASNGE